MDIEQSCTRFVLALLCTFCNTLCWDDWFRGKYAIFNGLSYQVFQENSGRIILSDYVCSDRIILQKIFRVFKSGYLLQFYFGLSSLLCQTQDEEGTSINRKIENLLTRLKTR